MDDYLIKFIVSIVIFVLISAIILLAINSSRKRSNSIEIEVSKFESMLKQEDLHEDLVNFCMRIVRQVQHKLGESNSSVLSNEVINQLKTWNYSDVLPEKEYKKIYLFHSEKINTIHSKMMDEYGMVPLDLGEAKHTESWSKEAQYAENALTQKISDVITRYEREM